MITAKPTVYRNVEFRSRLEARWAFFYDQLGLGWTYEPDGARSESEIGYLPDFWLDSVDAWVEIKPRYPSNKERKKAATIAEQGGRNCLIFYGDLTEQGVKLGWFESAICFTPDGATETQWWWTETADGRFILAHLGEGGDHLAERLQQAYRDAAAVQFGRLAA